jgi:hypothetical protein
MNRGERPGKLQALAGDEVDQLDQDQAVVVTQLRAIWWPTDGSTPALHGTPHPWRFEVRKDRGGWRVWSIDLPPWCATVASANDSAPHRLPFLGPVQLDDVLPLGRGRSGDQPVHHGAGQILTLVVVGDLSPLITTLTSAHVPAVAIEGQPDVPAGHATPQAVPPPANQLHTPDRIEHMFEVKRCSDLVRSFCTGSSAARKRAARAADQGPGTRPAADALPLRSRRRRC